MVLIFLEIKPNFDYKVSLISIFNAYIFEQSKLLFDSFSGSKLSIFKSIVYNLNGYTEPLTVTVSICLHLFLILIELNISNNSPVNKIGTPNYFVAASNLEAILTLGDK